MGAHHGLAWRVLLASTMAALCVGVMAVSPTPVQAAPGNRLLGEEKRTIYSRNRQASQVWHIQFWQRTPGPKVCEIFGRSLMDTRRGPGDIVDYLQSVNVKDLTTGISIGSGYKPGRPPIALETSGWITVPVQALRRSPHDRDELIPGGQ